MSRALRGTGAGVVIGNCDAIGDDGGFVSLSADSAHIPFVFRLIFVEIPTRYSSSTTHMRQCREGPCA